MNELSRFRALTRFFLRSSIKSRSFTAISVFTFIVAGILAFLTIELYKPNGAIVTPLAYLYGRLNGVLRVTLTYFLWAFPFDTIAVFSTAFLAAFSFNSENESGMKYFVYTLPARRSTLLFSKFSSAFLISSSISVIYYGIEGIFLSIFFHSIPPATFFLSFGLSLLLIGSVVSIVFFIGSFMNSPTFVVIAFLSIYFIVMETIQIATEILYGYAPVFLVSIAGSVVSTVFSGINLLPFGDAGTLSGTPLTGILMYSGVLFMYLITGLLSVFVMFRERDIR